MIARRRIGPVKAYGGSGVAGREATRSPLKLFRKFPRDDREGERDGGKSFGSNSRRTLIERGRALRTNAIVQCVTIAVSSAAVPPPPTPLSWTWPRTSTLSVPPFVPAYRFFRELISKASLIFLFQPRYFVTRGIIFCEYSLITVS